MFRRYNQYKKVTIIKDKTLEESEKDYLNKYFHYEVNILSSSTKENKIIPTFTRVKQFLGHKDLFKVQYDNNSFNIIFTKDKDKIEKYFFAFEYKEDIEYLKNCVIFVLENNPNRINRKVFKQLKEKEEYFSFIKKMQSIKRIKNHKDRKNEKTKYLNSFFNKNKNIDIDKIKDENEDFFKTIHFYYCPICKELHFENNKDYLYCENNDTYFLNIQERTESIFYIETESTTKIYTYNIIDKFIVKNNNNYLFTYKNNLKSGILLLNNSKEESQLFKEIFQNRDKKTIAKQVKREYIIKHYQKDFAIILLKFLKDNNLYEDFAKITNYKNDIKTTKDFYFFSIENYLLEFYDKFIFYKLLENNGKKMNMKDFFNFNYFFNSSWSNNLKKINEEIINERNVIDVYTGKKSTKTLKKNFFQLKDNMKQQLFLVLTFVFKDINYVHEIYKNLISLEVVLEQFFNDIKLIGKRFYYFLKESINLFTEFKVYHFFKTTKKIQISLIKDTLNQLYYIKQEIGMKKLKELFELNKYSIIGFHDEITKIYNQINTEKINLIYESDALDFFEKSYIVNGDKYEIRLPKSNIELIGWGRKLDHCVGSYFSYIVQKKTYIVGLFINGELEYAIEIIPNKSTIIQCKTNHNQIFCKDGKNTNIIHFIIQYIKDKNFIYKERISNLDYEKKISKANKEIKQDNIKENVKKMNEFKIETKRDESLEAFSYRKFHYNLHFSHIGNMFLDEIEENIDF